jgi:hypothetical protein
MADKRISQLDPLSTASSNDLFAIVDINVDETKKITVADLMGTPGPIGGGVASSGKFSTLTFNSGSIVDNISDDVNLGTSNTTLPTQGAVKTYIDSKIIDSENVRRVSSDTTAVALDIVLVDTTNGNVTIEMIDTNNGRLAIKKISDDSNQLIITSSSGSIDGQSQFIITTQFQSYNFLVDNGDFFVI